MSIHLYCVIVTATYCVYNFVQEIVIPKSINDFEECYFVRVALECNNIIDTCLYVNFKTIENCCFVKYARRSNSPTSFQNITSTLVE